MNLRPLLAAIRKHGLTVAIDWHAPIWTGRKRPALRFKPASRYKRR